MSRNIEDVVEEISAQWMELDGVEGIGQGKDNDKDCILVFVSRNPDELKGSIPDQFKGYAVKFMQSGEFRPEKD